MFPISNGTNDKHGMWLANRTEMSKDQSREIFFQAAFLFFTIVKFHRISISSSEHFGLIRCCGPEVEPDSHKVAEFSEDSNQ